MDQSDRHSVYSNRSDDINQITSISNNFKNPKKVLKDWSDEEDDVPVNAENSVTKNYENSQNNNRNYRKSSTDSLRSNRSHFQQNKNTSRFSQNHSNSPHSSKYRSSPYGRPENRQFREMSRESDSNVRPDRRNSNASAYSNRSGNQKYSNGRFEKSNSKRSSKYEDEFAKIMENFDKNAQEIPRHPVTEQANHNQHEDIPKNTADWSDKEDDVPASHVSNQRLPQNSPSSQINYVSSTTEADPPSNPAETQKKKTPRLE